ncbi:hypothetical protein MGWOODY_Tha48 [hydrothermal vent metagenome]|uniref:Uncharacterized protein n=1 Tax=hydrothermal vent metagenome TaxID=652676 RepID=A0A161KBU9_9ZZZZ
MANTNATIILRTSNLPMRYLVSLVIITDVTNMSATKPLPSGL